MYADVDDVHLQAPDLVGYALVASAIADRSLRVERIAADQVSYCTGSTIYLPSAQGPRSDLASLVVHASMAASGSLDPGLLRSLTTRRAALRRYLSLEGRRAVAELRGVAPSLLKLDALTPLTSSPAESLRVALGSSSVADPPPYFGAVKVRAVLAAARADQQAAAATSRALDRSVKITEGPAATTDDEAGEESQILKLLRSPLSRRLSFMRFLTKAGVGRRSSEGASGSELGTGRAQLGEQAAGGTQISLADTSLEPIVLPGSEGTSYPEYDVHSSRYRRRWCTVRDLDPLIVRPWEGPRRSSDITRRLARLGVGLERQRRQTLGDDLDLDALVESRVDCLAGSDPGEAVYVDNVRQRRNLGVLVLLDASGSSNEGPTGTTIHRRQCEGAAAITQALEDLGDRVGLYAFRSSGRSIDMLRLKAFDDSFDVRSYERLASIEPGSYTRLGAAVRHATRKLVRDSGTERRLLVVLSDGVPYDYGYEGTYAEGDASRALREARRSGVGCLCLSLGSATDEAALARVFGTAAHAAAPDIERLTPNLVSLFQQALATAERERSSSADRTRQPCRNSTEEA